MRPKSEIYTPKRHDEHPHPFHVRSPPPPALIALNHIHITVANHKAFHYSEGFKQFSSFSLDGRFIDMSNSFTEIWKNMADFFVNYKEHHILGAMPSEERDYNTINAQRHIKLEVFFL